MLPDYVSEELKAYFEVSSEDRRALLKEELFDDDPLSCDERYLPFFALELGVKIDDLSVPKQREAIANAIDELKRAGTVSYLKNNLKADVENELVELDDFHFRMDLFTQNIDEKFDEVRLGSIRQRVESFKNVRSVFDGVSFKLFFDEQVKVSGASSFKPKINQDANVGFRFEGLGFRTNGTVNTKIELNQVATYELHPTTSILNPTSGVVKPKINQDANVGFRFEGLGFRTNGTVNTKIELNQVATYELHPTTSILNPTSYILNPTLKKEATIETTLDSINQIQGAMTWQV